MLVLRKKFLQYFSRGFKITDGFEWNKNNPIYLKDIKDAIERGVEGETTPFGNDDTCEDKDNEYHIRRVIYFVNNPTEIKNIQISSFWFPNQELINIEDGWHRFVASLIVKHKYIDIDFVTYGVDTEIEDYLFRWSK